MREHLLELLRRRVRHHGLSMAHGSWLLDQLGASPAELRLALDVLQEQGSIKVLSPLPFLAVRITSLSGSNGDRVHEKQQSSESSAVALEGPVSSAAAASKQHGEG